MIPLPVAILLLALALLPAALTLGNLLLFRAPPRRDAALPPPAVSLLIPARDEAARIEAAVRHALASTAVDLEVIVLDDGSTDGTAAIVRRLSEEDRRVRLATAPPLPPGWCGKQHACHVLASLARHDLLAWIDADVRLEPDALSRMAAFLRRTGAGLVSGFPRQETVTLAEQLVVPQIHAVLLGYLPIALMRRSLSPGFGAGCGQLFLARRDAYDAAGGHAAIRASLHDGVTLPRAFRAAGFMTDLCDASALATCRMYRSAPEVWRGFGKNATEGMAKPVAIVVWTTLLLGGHVLPGLLWVLWMLNAVDASPLSLGLVTAAATLSMATSLALMFRFHQPLAAGLLRPLGYVVLLAIQWHALIRKLAGRPSGWKGRAYDAGEPQRPRGPAAPRPGDAQPCPSSPAPPAPPAPPARLRPSRQPSRP